MTTLPFLKLVPRLAATGSLATLCLLSASCKLPPREAWNNVQEHGLLPVLFDKPAGSPKAPSTDSRNIAETSANPEPATPDQINALRVQAVKQPEIASIPFATPVPGRQGYVYSPHTPGKKIVDVRSFAPGAEARCPYTLQSFHVPDTAAIAAAPPVSKPKPQRSVAEVATRTDRDSLDSDLGGITLPTPKTKPAPAPESESASSSGDSPEIPYGSRVAGRPGFVNSPFASKNQLVDVAGIAPGVEVKCPYTNKLFRVPEPLPEEMPPAPANIIPPAPPAPPAPSPAPVLPTTPEPKPTPADPAPTSSPSTAPAPATAPAPMPTPADAGSSPATASNSAPTAEWADKEKNQVQSPFGSPGQLIDVSGRAAGSTMQCPFTNKEFVIPAR